MAGGIPLASGPVMKTYATFASLGVLLFACASEAPSADGSDSALEAAAVDAELPLLPFDDAAECTLLPTSPASGDFKCLQTTRPVTSAFPTLAAKMIIRATTATGNSAEWTLPQGLAGSTLRLRAADMPVNVDVRLEDAKYGRSPTARRDRCARPVAAK